MSQDLSLMLKSQSSSLLADLKAISDYTMDSLNITSRRLERIKVGHATQTFSLPNKQVTQELKGWIIAQADFAELYEESDPNDDESKPPICVSISGSPGSRFGECSECEHGQWVDNPRNPEKKFKRCGNSIRLVIKIAGHAAPLELKIPQTSYASARKAIQSAINVTGNLIPYNVVITLTEKKEGTREWSLFNLKFEEIEYEDAEDLGRKVSDRISEVKNFMTYFKSLYGAMNDARAVNTGSAVKSEKTDSDKPAVNKAEEPEDAEIIPDDVEFESGAMDVDI